MVIKKQFITSNASRNFVNLNIYIYNLFYSKNLYTKKFKNKSISLKKRKLIYHKVKGNFREIIILNKKNIIIKLGLISNIIFSYKYKKFFSLIVFNNFTNVYDNIFNNLNIFTYYIFCNNIILFKYFKNIKNNKTYLGFLKINQKISSLFDKNNNKLKYIISSGCNGVVKDPYLFNNIVNIELPSKEIKYFSFFNIVNVGNIFFKEKNKLK